MKNGIDILIQGGAPGADRLAKTWADQYGVHHADVPALWDFYSKGAGPRRNSAMLLLQPDFLIAFPGGNGTADMISKATKAGVKIARAAEQQKEGPTK